MPAKSSRQQRKEDALELAYLIFDVYIERIENDTIKMDKNIRITTA